MGDWTGDFSLSLLRFWLRGQATVTEEDVKIETTSALRNWLPNRCGSRIIPLREIVSTTLETRFRVVRMALGIVVMLFGYFLILTSGRLIRNDVQSILVGLFGFAVGTVIFISGVTAALTLRLSQGTNTIEAPFYERGKLVMVEDTIRQAVHYQPDDMGAGLYMDRFARTAKERLQEQGVQIRERQAEP